MRLVAAVLALMCTAGAVAAQGVGDTLAVQLAAGDSAWAREDHPAALRLYGAVVRADSAFSTRALFRVGLLHAWRNNFPPAIAALKRYVRLEAADPEGRLALARTYAWANQFGPALAQYDTILAGEPDYRDAVIGRATTLAWADRLDEAESTMQGWLRRNPRDGAAWTQLAQFRRWRGDGYGAASALDSALALDPQDAEARTQRQWVEADLNPSVQVLSVLAQDSEQNDLRDLNLTAAVQRPGGFRYLALARVREVRFPGSDALRIPGIAAAVQWQPVGAAWTLRAEAGAVQYPEGLAPSAVQGRFGARASARVGPKWRVGAGIAREPFDDVLSMATRGLMFTVADADASYAVTTKTSLSAGASRGAVGGAGVDNARTTALAAFRYSPWRSTTLALSHREIRWDEPAFGVFFAPQTWRVTEASLGWTTVNELGLIAGGDLALGTQSIGFLSSPLSTSRAPRAAMRLGWRPMPGREIVASLLYANVAGVGAITASDYRYGALTLGGRWTF